METEGKPTRLKKWSPFLTCFKGPKRVAMDLTIKAEITWDKVNPVSLKTCPTLFQARIKLKSS
jgi:hypothetical protein